MAYKLTDALLTTGQLALYCGVTLRTVQRWQSSKRIKPASRTLGGHARYTPEQAKLIRKRLCEQANLAEFD